MASSKSASWTYLGFTYERASFDWTGAEDGTTVGTIVGAWWTGVAGTMGVGTAATLGAELNLGKPSCSNILGCITTKIGFPFPKLKGFGDVV